MSQEHEYTDTGATEPTAADEAGAPAQGMPAQGAPNRGMPAQGMPAYILSADALEYGASLGNARCWVTTRATGAIQEVFSSDLGQAIAGTVAVRYASIGHHLWRASAHAVDGAADVPLRRTAPGTVELHPAYQRHSFALPGGLAVQETVFVPLTCDDDPAVVYCQVAVTNAGDAPRSLRVYGYGRLCGALGADVAADYRADLRALVAANHAQPDAVRVFGCTGPIMAYETSHDFGCMYDVLHASALCGDTRAQGDILGALQVDLALAPGEREALAFVLAFSSRGEADAVAIYRDALDVDTALERTVASLAADAAVAQVFTPDPLINQGVLWSKVNMRRVMARYPQGPAFTNNPGISSAVVIRDVAWFVYGNDHFRPGFSRALLDTLAVKQYASGKLPEYYSALDGHVEDDGLNINDDTPLFILAVNHHYRASGDVAWLRRIYPAVARAAHYIIAQEDERGLVFCSAKDPRGNVWAIASWRNIIPGYTLNGAVTEINAECAAALRAAGHLAQNRGQPEQEAGAFFDAATRLRAAMDAHLINPRNGLYYLNIDADGIAHTDVTGDEIFPVMFRVCDDDTGFRIISRLSHPDFWTPGGVRTASTDDPLYDPARFVGLLGGVWPGLSWWYAFACARYHPELMVRALRNSFAHYAADPKRYNTVPGQFGEWFDGESLINRGMRLSPWEPPRFLWAAVEGVCGVVPRPGAPAISPLVPPHWRWLAVRRLPYHGREISFFATRERQGDETDFHIYSTMEVRAERAVEVYVEDVTDAVTVQGPDVCYTALRRPGETVLLIGNAGAVAHVVLAELSALLEHDTAYTVHLYDSDGYVWREGATSTGADLCMPAVSVEAGGFRLLRWTADQAYSNSKSSRGAGDAPR